MNRSNIIKLLVFSVIICPFIGLNLYAQSKSENFKLSANVLDNFGRRASSENMSLRISSGGQPVASRISMSSSFQEWSGYVQAATFVHADANADGNVTIADVVYMINYLFRSGSAPIPLETGDVDGNNEVTIVDAVYLVNYLFKGGPPPCS